jgi:hypothetical protein
LQVRKLRVEHPEDSPREIAALKSSTFNFLPSFICGRLVVAEKGGAREWRGQREGVGILAGFGLIYPDRPILPPGKENHRFL